MSYDREIIELEEKYKNRYLLQIKKKTKNKKKTIGTNFVFGQITIKVMQMINI